MIRVVDVYGGLSKGWENRRWGMIRVVDAMRG